MTSLKTSIRDAATVAEEAFVLAYPLLVTSRAMEQGIANRLLLRRGSPDTLRMSCWLDLGAEPVVLTAPDTQGRYYVLSLRDAWHTIFASVGARTTGTESHAFAVLGPGRHGAHLPPGVTALSAPTRFAEVAGCIEALGGRAAPPDEHLLDGFRVAPLSRWRGTQGHAPDPPAVLPDAWPAAWGDQLDLLDARAFFSE